jgi:serine protease Do
MKHLQNDSRRRFSFTFAMLAAGVTIAAAANLLADERADRSHEDSRGEPVDPAEAFGMDRLFVPRWRLTDGPHVRAAFRDVIKDARQATVCIHCDGKHTALGGIISPDGWIVTKATPLCGKLTAILADGRKLEATTVAEDGVNDLALLKVDANNLPAIDLNSPSEAPTVGAWLASVGRSKDPVAVGVVSVPAREIPPQAGVLGVELDEVRALVVKVFPDSAAEEADVKANDVILRVNGIKTPTREKLKQVVGAFNPGDEVELVVNREGKKLTLKATLLGHFPGLMDRSDFQNNLGGQLSVRRFGFPLALQHDTVLRPTDCGGPVVDVDGKVVGFNIARAGRTESFALPVSAVQDAVSKLMKDRLLVEAATRQPSAPKQPARSNETKPVSTPAAN